MSDEIETQIYLSIPATLAAETLSNALETGAIACVRCTIDDDKCDTLEALREACHAHDVPLLVDAPDGLAVEIAQRYGLDGVHIAPAPKTIDYARKELGKDAIIGANAGVSRHDAMGAAESGTDYVAFAAEADPDLLTWWAQVVETPMVVEIETAEQAISLAGIAEFVCLAPGIWSYEKSAADLIRAISEAR